LQGLALSRAFVKATQARRSTAARAGGDKIATVTKGAEPYTRFVSDASLTYLDGTLPGDYGFDPLGLSDPEGAGGYITPEWLSYAEVIHGRWAMLGAAGCLAPEILGNAGAIPAETGLVWFKSGVIPPAGSYDGYWGNAYTVFWVNVVLMQFAELRRWGDFKNPGSMGQQFFLGLEKGFGGSGNPAYPGGPFFNPFGFGKNEADLAKMKAREIKNGRLAMLAMFGFGAQAIMTGVGPVENLACHLSNPTGCNIISNFSSPFGQ
jgi:light-harvesting complex I chlorophyll a/b binding protein 3